jgi:SAM-dependent methyltransferase
MARHYDAHGWDWYASTAGDRLLALLEDRGVVPPASVLDVGCGTGSLALRLAERGYRVTGIDFSPAMIESARAKDRNGQVDWRTGDVTALALGLDFDAAVSVGDVLNHLPRLEDWEAAFRSIRGHLRSDGIAVVDGMTARGLAGLEQQCLQERDGKTLLLACTWEPAERRSTLRVVSFIPSPTAPGFFERGVATITEWAQPVADLMEAARRAGFSEVERVWSSSPDGEDEDRLTLLGRVK